VNLINCKGNERNGVNIRFSDRIFKENIYYYYFISGFNWLDSSATKYFNIKAVFQVKERWMSFSRLDGVVCQTAKPREASVCCCQLWRSRRGRCVSYIEKCCDFYHIMLLYFVYSTHCGKYEVKRREKRHWQDDSGNLDVITEVAVLFFTEQHTSDPQ